MKYVALGRTGLRVSRLCFGTLTIGPLQRDFGIDHASALLKSAYDLGVTFFDTAEIYGTYPHLKAAFEKQDDVVIATKCYAYDEATARESLEKARRGLGRDHAAPRKGSLHAGREEASRNADRTDGRARRGRAGF